MSTLLVAGCSKSLVDNYAVDWIIQSLGGLTSVSVINSLNVEPHVQPEVFPHISASAITCAVQVYAGREDLMVLQVRSSVVNRKKFADEIIDYANSKKCARIVVAASVDGCLMSGPELEDNDRLRVVNSISSRFKMLDLDDVHSGGLLKALVKRRNHELPVTGIAVMVSGLGFVEVRQRSEELARAVLEVIGGIGEEKPLDVPLSIKQLETDPPVSIEVGRIL